MRVCRYVSSHCLLQHRSGGCSVLFFSYTNKLSVQTTLLSFPLCRARLELLKRHSQGMQSVFSGGKRSRRVCRECWALTQILKTVRQVSPFQSSPLTHTRLLKTILPLRGYSPDIKASIMEKSMKESRPTNQILSYS